MNTAFIELAIVLGLSSLLGFLIKYLKQPLLMAYLLAGVVISLVKILDPSNSLPLTFFPEFGIAFVLFFIGMELDLREIKSLGLPIVVSGLVQMVVATVAGFAMASLLGFSQMDSLYLGIGLSFSSTIVVVKLLLERKDLSSLYGKLALGVLLLEDLVAIVVLMVLSVGTSFANLGVQESFPLIALLGKGVLLFVISLLLSRYVLNAIFNAVAENAELLFLTALTWCFSFIALAQLLGFSLVIGAFLAGVALATSPYHYQIQGKVKPLRDFFVALFFVYLGSHVEFSHISSTIPVILLFTLFACVGKPLLYLLLFGSFGFRKHTIFKAALSLSQISEFSLVIALVGLRIGVVGPEVLSTMALTGVLSILISSAMISSSKQIYKVVSPFVSFFVRSEVNKSEEGSQGDHELEDHVVVVGAHRMGGQLVEYLRKEEIHHMVVDFNPHLVRSLLDKGYQAVFGDVSDPEIMDVLNIDRAKMVISTSQDLEDNLHLLDEAKHRKIKAIMIIRATTVAEAVRLYKAGADYVILPEIVSGAMLTDLLKTHWSDKNYFEERAAIELKKLSGHKLSYEIN